MTKKDYEGIAQAINTSIKNGMRYRLGERFADAELDLFNDVLAGLTKHFSQIDIENFNAARFDAMVKDDLSGQFRDE